MNKLVKYLFTFALMVLAAYNTQAQDAEMADTMRSEGKIYVVVAIVMVILLSLIAYVISLDRKVSGLEKRLPEKKK
jgi:tellurite resistance protein TehA-like permease